jgi:hypothetical protein
MWCIAQNKPKHVKQLLKFGADPFLASPDTPGLHSDGDGDAGSRTAMSYALDVNDAAHLQCAPAIAATAASRSLRLCRVL